eukprot:3286065-Prymnesium_polylepis.1
MFDPVPVVVGSPEAAADSIVHTQTAGGMNRRKQVFPILVPVVEAGIPVVSYIAASEAATLAVGGASTAALTIGAWFAGTTYIASLSPPQHIPFYFDRGFDIVSWDRTLSLDGGKDVVTLTVAPTTKKQDPNCPSPCGDDLVKVGLRAAKPMKFKGLERYDEEIKNKKLVGTMGGEVLLSIDEGSTETTWWYFPKEDVGMYACMHALATEGDLWTHVAKYHLTQFHTAKPESQTLDGNSGGYAGPNVNVKLLSLGYKNRIILHRRQPYACEPRSRPPPFTTATTTPKQGAGRRTQEV